MAVLVDTTVWIDHLRIGDPALKTLLYEDQVLGCDLVQGELALGSIRNRKEILSLYGALPKAEIPTHQEILKLIEHRKLNGSGIGWVDVQVLGAALLSGAKLWTRDRKLKIIANKLKCSYPNA